MGQFADLSNDAKKALLYLAAEFKLTQELLEHLQKIKEDAVHVDQNIREAHKMLQVYRWLAKAERKVAYREDHITELFHHKQLEFALPPGQSAMLPFFRKQLEVADKTLKKLASFYEGSVGKEIREIEQEEEILRRLEKKKSDAQAVALKRRLEAELARLETDLQELEKWIKSNTAILLGIRKWAEEVKNVRKK